MLLNCRSIKRNNYSKLCTTKPVVLFIIKDMSMKHNIKSYGMDTLRQWGYDDELLEAYASQPDSQVSPPFSNTRNDLINLTRKWKKK